MALDSVPELLATINRLPPTLRSQVRDRVEQAIDRPAVEARAALGLLALELAAIDRGEVTSIRPPASPAAVGAVLHHATA